MIALGNWAKTDQTISLDIDWKNIRMDPATAKIEIPSIEGLQSQGPADLKNLFIPASKGLVLIISEK